MLRTLLVGEAATRGPGAKPRRAAAWVRILVEGRSGSGAEEAAIALAVATALTASSLGHGWRVSRLFGPVEEEDELARFFAVTGMVDAYALPAVAWEVAYLLADALAGVAVEVIPDLPSSLNAPSPDEPDLLAAAVDLPRDWSLKSIRCRGAWRLSPPPGGAARGAGIRIGHPDTGYVVHPDFEIDAVDLALDADVIAGDDDATDPLEEFPGYQPGHGTRTGSVIAGRGTGVLTGVAPESTLVPIRTVKSVVQFFDGDVARAVEYARAAGCHVVSMSLGGLGFRGLEAVIDRAVREGVIVMAAAGNQLGLLGYMVVWPARYANCIAVAASNASDRGWRHSSRGSKVVVAAPGEDVWVPELSRERDPPIEQSSGTSYAVAHLAGAAALWLAFHGRDRLIQRYGAASIQAAFVAAVRATARKPRGWDTRFGAGILNAERLLRAELPAAHEVDAVTLDALAPEEDDLHAVFPELEPEAVDAQLGDLEDERTHLRRATMRRELLYVFTENPGLRVAFVERSAGPLDAPGDALELVVPYASRTLAAALRAR